MSKVFIKKKSKEEIEVDKIIGNIDGVLEQIKAAYAKFNTLTDDNLVEATIFEIKSLEARYKHLIEEAKSKNISVNAKRTIFIPSIIDAEYAIS